MGTYGDAFTNKSRTNRWTRTRTSVNGLFIVRYLVIVTIVANVEAKNRICRNFESARNRGFFEERVPSTFSSHCPPSSSPYNLYVVENGQEEIDSDEDYLTLLVCWTNDVRRFALQFHDNVHLDISTPSPVASVRTCVATNDTVYYRHKYHGFDSHKLLLNLSTASTFKFRGYFDTRKNYARHHHVITYNYNRGDTRRVRRSTEESIEVTDASECGSTRSCVRYGSSDCGHFSCTYFVSTNVTGRDVDIELSAKTNGWVGLGLSSDTKMGGDEVIACYKSDPTSSVVQAATFQNPYSHDPTKRKDSDAVKLRYSKIKDGYLYCRLTRPEWPKDHQDLSAIWYQLYASGPVSRNGELEKHHVTPSVSNKMISLLHKYNIIGQASQTTPSLLTHILIACVMSILGN